MNIRRSLSNLFRSREDAELARRAIAEREEELEERRQSQERMREQVAQLLEEVDTPANASWRYVDSSVRIPLDNPVFPGRVVRTIQNGNNQIFEIDLNELPDSDDVPVDSKNKMRKIFGSKDV